MVAGTQDDMLSLINLVPLSGEDGHDRYPALAKEILVAA